MTLTIRQVHPHFVGEVTHIDLTRPLTPAQAREIDEAMARYGVLVFPGQPLSDDQQIAFSRNFGELEVTLAGQIRVNLLLMIINGRGSS